jgi:hypothetical protein
MTQVSAHELAEGITDPVPPSGYTDPTYSNDGGEVGDHGGNSAYMQDGYSVQALWSNAISAVTHAPSSGSKDLFINQVTPPAVNTFKSGPVATFTDLDTSLTASSFFATVSDVDFTAGTQNDWTNVKISGSKGHFVINATPPKVPLSNGTVGSAFNGDGITVTVSTSAINTSGSPSGAPIALRNQAYTVKSSAPLTYNADSGSGTNNFTLKKSGTDFQLSNNGLVVFTQPAVQTTSILINADPATTGDSGQNIHDSLTIDYSGGTFTNSVTFDGGPGSGNHSITFTGGSFSSVTYTPTSATGGTFTLDSQTITFSHVNTAIDLTTASSITLNGTSSADQINLVDGPTVGSTATSQFSSSNGTFATVDFANKTTETIKGLAGADVITVNAANPEASLAALNVNSGATSGVVINVQQTPSAVVTSVLGGGANVTVNVGNAGSVQGINGTLNVDNSSGARNQLTVIDSADSNSQTITLTSRTIHGIAPTDIKYVTTGTSGLTIDGGSGGNFFDLQSLASGIATSLNGGTGNDTFNIFPQTTGVNLSVDGQAPTTAPGDTLVYVGPGVLTSGATGSGSISQSGHASITFAGIETINVGAAMALTTVAVSPTSIQLIRTTATVTLTAFDAKGNQESSGGLAVVFGLGSGSASGTFGTVTDNHNGTYTAIFTGTQVGTSPITAMIGGESVTSPSPNITVTLGSISLSQSTVSASPLTIQSGGTSTITLQVVDNGGSHQTIGGLPISFGVGAGTGSGTFSTVTDNNNGTYTAILTGTTVGSNTITTSIGG